MLEQKTLSSQCNTTQEDQSWRTDTTQPQDILENYNNQDSVAFAKEKTNEWNDLGIPKVDPHKYSQLISDQRTESTQWRKERNLLNKWCWNNWVSPCVGAC